jgi:F-type H+-transporting ATPase subunit b
VPVQALRTWASAAVITAAFVAGPAFAAGDAQKSGMPQFNVTNFPSQVFWLVVSFAVLYFLMATTVLPRIGKIVEGREGKIQSDLDAAQKANDAARVAAAEQEKALAEARSQASVVVREATDKAAQHTTAKLHELGDKLAATISEAELRIGQQRTQAISGLAGMSSEIASAVLAKLVGSADAAQVARAVDAATKAGKA